MRMARGKEFRWKGSIKEMGECDFYLILVPWNNRWLGGLWLILQVGFNTALSLKSGEWLNFDLTL